ncbi:serine/threonine-protein kinase 10-like [Mercenaria mercenaria]|uniref:serine/threonine-protein kinase 10-like n=1 Tax=Mercenaria mercenaria TaxID=6596 RepID=UPI00234F396C|nr:serine/threonine-protein kinase 10-like [Mercenaria mercenaria]
MEYCDGGTIDQVSREGLTEDRIRVYTKELLTAVQMLHDNDIVHRDIKGTNIYLTSSGCLKLGHLTCAVKLKSQTTNEMDKLVGTIAYMAPEVITQTCKEKHIRASDIWSVGCVIIEMATGKPPWHDLGNSFQIMFRVGTGETPPTPENLCDAGKDFLSHCLEQEPDKRWTASQLKDHPFAKVFSKCETTDEESDDDCDDVDDDYYDYNDDQDVEAQAEVKSETPEKGESDQEDERFFGGKTNPAAFQRLVKDLRNMKKDAHKFGIEGTPRGDNLFIWDVKLTGFPADTALGKDIRNWAEKHKREPVVYLEMQFPDEYPMAPPFVRVTRPRFKFFSGHVTIGGSICMETLTKSGWTPTNDLQSILAEIRSEIMGDPNMRLDSNPDREYGEAEARDAFNRMVNRYDWNK